MVELSGADLKSSLVGGDDLQVQGGRTHLCVLVSGNELVLRLHFE